MFTKCFANLDIQSILRTLIIAQFFQFVHIKGSYIHFRNMVKYPFCEQTGTVGISDKVIVNLVMDRHNSDGMEARRRVIVSVSHKPYDG